MRNGLKKVRLEQAKFALRTQPRVGCHAHRKRPIFCPDEPNLDGTLGAGSLMVLGRGSIFDILGSGRV
eukprot:3814593-Rhodomonas_salina.1